MDDGVGTQEVICGASNYQNVLGGGFIKGVESMVYDILDEVLGREYQVEYCIPLVASRFSSLHTTEDTHDIMAIGIRFYTDVR